MEGGKWAECPGIQPTATISASGAAAPGRLVAAQPQSVRRHNRDFCWRSGHRSNLFHACLNFKFIFSFNFFFGSEL